jgi:hypothetical protein
MKKPLLILICVLLTLPAARAERGPANKDSLAKTNLLGNFTYFTINNIFSMYMNTMEGANNFVAGYTPGFEWPKGSNTFAIFEDGFIYGGYFRSTNLAPRRFVNGSTYRTGFQEGGIVTPGNGTDNVSYGGNAVPESPDLPSVRVYRTRPDLNPYGGKSMAELEAILKLEEVPLIKRFQNYTAAQLYDKYKQDWDEWPWQKGAPYKDLNHDGAYDPHVDIPGIPGAAQTLWHTSNDMSVTRQNQFAGSIPVGIEFQRTIWGYSRQGSLGNALFMRYRLINKSGAPLDTLFAMLWSDPDLGYVGDDYVGCDTTRSLGFCYNGRDYDREYGYACPAVGYRLLQGPVVPGTKDDSALSDFHYRSGLRNLPLYAFNIPISGGLYEDPSQYMRTYWWNMLTGREGWSGNPWVDPAGNVTRYVLAGDPVTGMGWLDGSFDAPGDRRMTLSTGPFFMQPMDTQEVVFAAMVAQGADRLSSITALRAASDEIQGFHNSLYSALPANVAAKVYYLDHSTAQIYINAEARGIEARTITAHLQERDGSPMESLVLYDDGIHGDGKAGDEVFANSIHVNRRSKPLVLDAEVAYEGGTAKVWPGAVPTITTAGRLTIDGPVIFSDNLNGDGVANFGENVRWGLTLENGTGFTLKGVRVTTQRDPRTTHPIPVLGSSTTVAMIYDPGNPESYFTTEIPTQLPGSGYTVPITVTDSSGNSWHGEVMFMVYRLQDTLRITPIAHLSGGSTGDFAVAVVSPEVLKNHLYVIRGVDSVNAIGEAGFTLKDSTDGRTLLINHSLPDILGHHVPPTDGFKIQRGTVDTVHGYGGYSAHPDPPVWSKAGTPSTVGLEGFGGTIGTTYKTSYFSSTVAPLELHDVLILFAETDTTGTLVNPSDSTVSYAYRYLRGSMAPPAKPEFAQYIIKAGPGIYQCQDFRQTMPFAAYDVQTTPHRRLAVGFLENNVAQGMVDGKYWPPASPNSNSAAREWFFIFNLPYTTTPDLLLQVDLYQSRLPIMWWGTPTRRAGMGFRAGDTFTILAYHAPSSADTWTFNPTTLRLVPDPEISISSGLLQNYPNPFNPSTTIRYSLGATGRVTLKIYNLLGQHIRTLVDDVQERGEYAVPWNGTNDSRTRVASGVYFYRLEAGPFTQIKKLLIVR